VYSNRKIRLIISLVVAVCVIMAGISSVAWAKKKTAVKPQLATDVKIAAGESTSAALRSDGSVWVWGSNDSGQLGNGSTDDKPHPYPTMVNNLKQIKDIRISGKHLLALKNDGAVFSWGDNICGQLGNGKSGVYSLEPSKIKELSGIVMIETSCESSMALKNDGTVWAWGRNFSSSIINTKPVKVQSLSNVKYISMGANDSGQPFAFAIKKDGSVVAWGSNDNGQLGDGTKVNRNVPVLLKGIKNIVSITCGDNHVIALKNDGTLLVWGSNELGQLGLNNVKEKLLPYRTKAVKNIIKIASGQYHNMAISKDGSMWAWGANWCGQLGDGTTNYCSIPCKVNTTNNVIKVACGKNHSIAVQKDASVWEWGATNVRKTGGIQLTPLKVTFKAVAIDNNSKLIDATIQGDVKKIKSLLKAGANPNYIDVYGSTCIMYASSKGRADIIKMLVEFGGDPNIARKENGSTALMIAAQTGQLEAAKALISVRANPNAVSNATTGSYTAVIYALHKGHSDIAKYLLDSGADAKILKGEQLLAAVGVGDINIVKQLLQMNVDPNAEGTYFTGCPSLFRTSSKEIVDVLIKAGANTNFRITKTGVTPLMTHVERGNIEVVKLLLAAGVEVNLKDNEGRTALSCAQKLEDVKIRDEIIAILKNAGAQ
jgi:alpha-tubulin suppressor-like RCC1 family protein/ankyrin repeat protein